MYFLFAKKFLNLRIRKMGSTHGKVLIIPCKIWTNKNSHLAFIMTFVIYIYTILLILSINISSLHITRYNVMLLDCRQHTNSSYMCWLQWFHKTQYFLILVSLCNFCFEWWELQLINEWTQTGWFNYKALLNSKFPYCIIPLGNVEKSTACFSLVMDHKQPQCWQSHNNM